MFWIIVTLFLPCGGLALTQTPISYLGRIDKTVRFKCAGQGRSTVIHWYQQKPGQAPSRILYSGSSVIRDPEFGSKFSADREDKLCTLIIKTIAQEDAATYYCAYWEAQC
ncbi:hypothetical protein scyTo_0023256 [Scyliorhinus torazame]|uniref:Ig-like domain-containing protein n=1 Tax=Scyliorhinus torazame TaxID=75743 RepID=A0A401Q6C3_SCYTO|nr:hypothetical protein [Scyliorhinus torazame]